LRATIRFIDSKGGDKGPYLTDWMPGGNYSIELEIDDKDKRILVATQMGKMLVPLHGETGKQLLGNQDIELELESGHTSLGRWYFQVAIMEGAMQEVSPKKLFGCY